MSLGSKLSPKLRKAILKTPGDTIVRCLVELAPGADEEALGRALTSLGAEVRTQSDHARLLTIDVPVSRLPALESLKDIVYVEAGELYRR